jgi:3-oxoacyl-[acyl-carrier-protein] synthase II
MRHETSLHHPLAMIATRALLSQRRVVVTGIGAITPLGNNFQSTWQNILSSDPQSSIGITSLEEAMVLQQLPSQIMNYEISLAKNLPSQVAAPVRGVDYCPRTTRFVQLALLAAKDGILNSGLDSWLRLDNENDVDNEEETQMRLTRIGTCIGSGMSSVREVVAAQEIVGSTQSLRRLSPHFVPKVLCNSASARVSLEYKLQGPNLAPSTACAAGGHAIGEAMRCIQYGDVDIMIAGGAEACIDPISMGGFARLKALSTNFNDRPKEASRPFDKDRDGFVMGEGSAVLILEELEHAKNRGASILCEVRGYGISGDGFHVTSPDPNGKGAERAMRMALDRAGIDVNSVDYVNAHATSTPMGDEIEERTIARVAASNNDRKKNLYVSSTKGATGHLLGAAGAIEGAITAMTIKDGTIPPTQNLRVLDFQGFHHVTDSCIKDEIKVAVSNSFGFGGTNVSVVFTSLDF